MLFVRSVFILIVLIFTLPTKAATDAELAEEARNAAEFQLRDKAYQQEFEEKIANPSRPVQLPEAQELPEVTSGDICFAINEIQVEGLLANWIRDTGSQYVGKCVGHKSITDYIRVINQQLLASGYITSRAILPEQDLSKGSLSIQILEGVIESIVFPDDYHFYWQHALPMAVGDVLNMRDLEQGVEQFNRLNSQSIELKIEPGSKSGASKVVAYIEKKKPWQYGVSIDDNGSDSTGKHSLATTITLNNLLRVQDVIGYSTSQDADTNDDAGSTSETLTLSLPFGYWLLDFSFNQFDYYQEVEGDVASFESSGSGHDEKVTLSLVAFRDNTVKLSGSLAIKKRSRRNFIADGEIENQRRNLTNATLSGNYRHYYNGSVIDVSVNLDQGINLLNSEQVDDTASSDTAQPDYRLYGINASLNLPFVLWEKKFNLASQFRFQHADTALYTLDWFSNGGRYTVRGFASDESVSAEQGWRLRNDLTIPISIKDYSISSYIGLDVGYVSGDGTDDIDEKTLMGLTIGAKGELYGANYEVFVSQPLFLYGPYTDGGCCEAGFSLSLNF